MFSFFSAAYTFDLCPPKSNFWIRPCISVNAKGAQGKHGFLYSALESVKAKYASGYP